MSSSKALTEQSILYWNLPWQRRLIQHCDGGSRAAPSLHLLQQQGSPPQSSSLAARSTSPSPAAALVAEQRRPTQHHEIDQRHRNTGAIRQRERTIPGATPLPQRQAQCTLTQGHREGPGIQVPRLSVSYPLHCGVNGRVVLQAPAVCGCMAVA